MDNISIEEHPNELSMINNVFAKRRGEVGGWVTTSSFGFN